MCIHLQLNPRIQNGNFCHAKSTMEDLLEDYEENQHFNTDIHGFARSPANSQSCWGFYDNGIVQRSRKRSFLFVGM